MPKFSCRTDISPCGRYIRTDVEGTITQETAIEFAARAFLLGEKNKICWFFFDVRNARNSIGVPDNMNITQSPFEDNREFATCFREVVLVSPGDRSHDLVVQMVRAQGLAVYQTTDEAGGIAWLTKSSV